MPPTLWAYGFIVSTNWPGRTMVADSRAPPVAGARAADGPPPGAAGGGARDSHLTPYWRLPRVYTAARPAVLSRLYTKLYSKRQAGCGRADCIQRRRAAWRSSLYT